MSDDGQFSAQLLAEIEDRLFPTLALDVWERCLYYHLLRHTRLLGVDSVLIGVDAVARRIDVSEDKARKTLRSMDRKGCIHIEDRNRKGHVVRVLLPDEIDRVRDAAIVETPVDIEEIDFYSDRRHLPAILRRDNNECFYCRRTLTRETVVLDHVIALAAGGSASHRNVVASCHECNSHKAAVAADEFMRSQYRRGILAQPDLVERLDRLARLQAGQLPIIMEDAE